MRRAILFTLLVATLLMAGCAAPTAVPTPTPVPAPTAAPTPVPPPQPNYENGNWGVSLWMPEGWVSAEEAFEVVNAVVFGSSAQAVAWDESSITHTSGGAELQHLTEGVRLRITTAAAKDAPDLTPEGYVDGISSQIGAFEKGVEVESIEVITIGGHEGALVIWEGVRTGAEVSVHTVLAATRANGWDYRFQFDCLPEEWGAASTTWETILETIVFSEPQR